MEIVHVMKWIDRLKKLEWKGKKILLHDIGIVSPYKKQCSLIKEELTNNAFGSVDVGTAEIFQGSERRIIIISTVRTGGDLGFVKNTKVILHEKSYFRINFYSFRLFIIFFNYLFVDYLLFIFIFI